MARSRSIIFSSPAIRWPETHRPIQLWSDYVLLCGSAPGALAIQKDLRLAWYYERRNTPREIPQLSRDPKEQHAKSGFVYRMEKKNKKRSSWTDKLLVLNIAWEALPECRYFHSSCKDDSTIQRTSFLQFRNDLGHLASEKVGSAKSPRNYLPWKIETVPICTSLTVPLSFLVFSESLVIISVRTPWPLDLGKAIHKLETERSYKLYQSLSNKSCNHIHSHCATVPHANTH